MWPISPLRTTYKYVELSTRRAKYCTTTKWSLWNKDKNLKKKTRRSIEINYPIGGSLIELLFKFNHSQLPSFIIPHTQPYSAAYWTSRSQVFTYWIKTVGINHCPATVTVYHIGSYDQACMFCLYVGVHVCACSEVCTIKPTECCIWEHELFYVACCGFVVCSTESDDVGRGNNHHFILYFTLYITFCVSLSFLLYSLWIPWISSPPIKHIFGSTSVVN